jgi:cellulose synthase (UDP-forming)
MFGESLHLLPLLLTSAVFLGLLPILRTQSNWVRAVVALLVAALGLRYAGWRLIATVLPASGSFVAVGWIWLCYLAEVAALTELLVILLIFSRHVDRSAEADRLAKAFQATPDASRPSVDIFIPTFNEGIDVLEKTIAGAKSIDYPNFCVWVLDDGRRPWLRDFCRAAGVGYLARGNNRHAKAGNLNAALARTRGDFIAILDADFVPFRNFLARTLPLFDDPAVGIVQTPQHFYNRDPIQTNLSLHRSWPDEQRLFFDVMAPCRDAWDAAFCCGSCSVIRRAALDAIGGFPVASITEDLLTTLAMLRKGYITRYLNERLSVGLAAESIDAFFVQRQRWARGAMQALYLKEGPLGPGVPWLHRILFFPFSWIIQYPVRLIGLLVPVVYLWTGLTPLEFTDLDDLLAYQLPLLLASGMGMRWLAPDRYAPLLSVASGVFASFRLLPTIVHSLIRPFGQPFKVTPKGRQIRILPLDVKSLAALTMLALLTAGGLVINAVPHWQIIESRAFFPIVAAWAFFNLVVLFVAGLMCFEAPRHRREERFPVNEATVLTSGQAEILCRLKDLSLGGARVRIASGGMGDASPSPGDPATLQIVDAGAVAATVVACDASGVRLTFTDLTADLRERLIVKLYTGRYHNGVERLHLHRLVLGLVRRIFAAPAAGTLAERAPAAGQPPRQPPQPQAPAAAWPPRSVAGGRG